MKLTKKLIALLAGAALTLTFVSCGDLLNVAKEIAKDLLTYEADEETEEEEATKAKENAPSTTSETAVQTEVGGSFQFNLAATGNSNSNHYFDTSSTNVFDYITTDGTTKEKCYYQFQFNYKGSGKGNWYLYMRCGGEVVAYKDEHSNEWDKKFIAYGTYAGDCFNASSGEVAAGTLSLKTVKGQDWATVTVATQNTDPKASFNVAFSGSNGASITSARADAVEK